MIYNLILLLALGSSLYSQTEGCGRVPATPKPTTPLPSTTPNPTGSSNSLPCTPEEETTLACFNNGTCFVYILNGERMPSCHCTKFYMGQRCEQLNPDVWIPAVEPDQVATAGIAASLAVLIIIIIVFTAVAIVYYKRRKEEKEERRRKAAQNGTQCGNHTGNGSTYHYDEKRDSLLDEYIPMNPKTTAV